jgi:long-chain acyl-CoA synthetase
MTSEPGSLGGWAEVRPEATACVDRGIHLSWADLHATVEETARRLGRLGVGSGERVMLALDNGAPFVVTYLALRRLSAVAVPLNPAGPPRAAAVSVADASPRAIVCEPRLVESFQAWGGSGDALSPLRAGRGEVTVLTRPAEPPSGPDQVVESPEGLGAIIYTSGTTGLPKGVMLSAANLDAIAEAGCDFVDLRPEDRIGVITPLFHLYGLRDIDAAVRSGGCLVMAGPAAFPAKVLETVRDEGVTALSGVPSGLRPMTDRLAPLLEGCADRLRYVAMGTAAASAKLLAGLGRALPRTRLLVTYGLTELSRACYRDVRLPDAKAGSVGRPYSGVELAILGEDGAPVAEGRTGRVHLRSSMVMLGYWRRADLTAAVLRPDGWLVTPDVGRRDTDGDLFLVGRADEVINVGGEKVGPEEVEDVLRAHPDVQDAAVVGLADPAGRLGQVVKAFVVATPGAAVDEEAIFRHCADRLEPFKVPRLVEFRDELPKAVLGKTARGRLAEASPAARE